MTKANKTATKNETHKELQQAYNHFNCTLFKGELPRCIITLNCKGGTAGYFVDELWQHVEAGNRTDEISINPDTFQSMPLIYVMQTLVHEMCHQWQARLGKPSRRGYHNKEWSQQMESIGLMPSSTGKAGGKKVGQKMSDHPIEGGRFEKQFNKLVAKGFKINWMPANMNPVGYGGGTKSSKTKYTCSGCNTNIWGKPALYVKCGDCNIDFMPDYV